MFALLKRFFGSTPPPPAIVEPEENLPPIEQQRAWQSELREMELKIDFLHRDLRVLKGGEFITVPLVRPFYVSVGLLTSEEAFLAIKAKLEQEYDEVMVEVLKFQEPFKDELAEATQHVESLRTLRQQLQDKLEYYEHAHSIVKPNSISMLIQNLPVRSLEGAAQQVAELKPVIEKLHARLKELEYRRSPNFNKEKMEKIRTTTAEIKHSVLGDNDG